MKKLLLILSLLLIMGRTVAQDTIHVEVIQYPDFSCIDLCDFYVIVYECETQNLLAQPQLYDPDDLTYDFIITGHPSCICVDIRIDPSCTQCSAYSHNADCQSTPFSTFRPSVGP